MRVASSALPSPAVDTRLTSALSGYRARYPGQEGSWKRLEGWLFDHAPDERRAVRAIVAVARLDLHRELARATGRIDAFAFRRVTDALTANEGLSADLAEQAVLAWLAAMEIEPPDPTVLRGPVDAGAVAVRVEAARCLHLALARSELRPISQVHVENLGTRPLSELTVAVWLAGTEVGSALRSSTWQAPIASLRGRQTVLFDRVDVQLALSAMHDLRAPVAGRFWIEVKTREEVLLRTFHELEVAPPATWVFGRVPLPALAAFVLREDTMVAELVGEAGAKIDDADPRPAAVKAYEALSRVVSDLGLAWDARAATRVLAPRAIVAGSGGSLLDRQMLLAACLEHAGLPPMLIWTSTGPALGLYCGTDRPTLTETDDPELLKRLCSSGALAIVSMGAAIDLAGEQAGSPAFAALDVAAARRLGVLPLDAMVLDDGRAPKIGTSAADLSRQRVLDRAGLAGTRSGLLLPGAWGARLARRRDAPDATAPRLQTWKRRLLDLTLNNPLLSLRERVTSLPLIVHDVAALEDALATGRIFRLEPRPSAPTPGAPRPDVTKAMTDGAMAAGGLLVDLPEKRVATQAKNAARAFRGALEEGGVHTLFLALGMLEWVEAGKADRRLAPLLLVPVLLRRSRAGHYEIKKAEAETELNAPLVELLRQEHGVEVLGVDPLPADHAGVDVAAVLDAFQRAIAKTPATAAWTIRNEAQIGVLAFSGFRMWRDLDHQAGDLLRHPLVKRLVYGGDDGEPARFVDPSALDDRPARDVLCPLEADATQLAAVLSAADGASFVLEGPPGTGKSQTIANLIAQCLALGKSVLFVAQKRAALEVVESRLTAIGLGPFVLELYSKKASKPEFIQQLRDAAELRARRPPRDWGAEADGVSAARSDLNGLVRALHRERAPGMSVFDAIARFEGRRDGPRLDATFDPARAFEPGWVDAAIVALGELGPCFARLGEGWEDLEAVRATDWPKARRDELEIQLAELVAASTAVQDAVAPLSAWMPGLEGLSADDLELGDLVLAGVETSTRPKLALLRSGGEDAIEAWTANVEAARAAEEGLADRYHPSLVDEALEPRLRRLRQWHGVFFLGWLVLLTVRWFFRPLVRGSVPSNATLLVDTEAAVGLTAKRAAIAAETTTLAPSVGDVRLDSWGLPIIDVAEIRAHTTFARTYRKRAARFPGALDLAADGAPDVGPAITELRAAIARYSHARRTAAASLDLAAGFSKPTESDHLRLTSTRAARIRARVPMLRDWGAYRASRDACVALGLGPTIRAFERREVPAETLTVAFENSWLAWWIDQCVREDKALSQFDGLKHRGKELRFGELDRALRELSRHEVQHRVASRMPRLDEGAPPTSQAGILLRQFNRRAGFASPRQLFGECAGLIRQLKPCVLMSPQSVAQYLDPSQPPFDLVIFDEASQVPTHEAIGAIARGRQVVVVGDSKQLPPTAFFLGGAKAEDDDGEIMTELDSILEECAASGLPNLRLGWHYRSRHPSLIAFSNVRYYGSHLQVLPAAHARAPHLGVSRVLVQGAVYDRGGTATNAVEARALVDELVRRLRDPVESRRTIGAVTFSRAQQALVEDMLEEARDRFPEIEPFFDPDRAEPVIVKNLENIQGDERDVILFSIGYGPDARGRVTANMGPLGQIGGERRLNVAVTRAREQLIVYVSFEPDRLDLSASAAQGLHDLKAFLESAAASGEGIATAATIDGNPAEITLERALGARLEAAGFAVDYEVGVGRYRIDLAVRHRKVEGAYVLGVELDGPRYAETATARDRDRLRWDVLATLGWRSMHRVRALDWHEDRDATVAEVLRRIDEAERLLEIEPTPEPAPIDLGDRSAPANDAGASEYATRTQTATPYKASRPTARTDAFSWWHASLPAVFAEIVAAEGPIGERLAARRVADVWGLKRSPAGLSANAEDVLSRIPADQRPSLRGGFFWPPGVDPETWRGYRVPDPSDGMARRDAEDIPIEELANAADDLLAAYGTMPREDLARAVAKRFGFRGLTRVVGERVEQGIAHAEDRKA